MSTRPPPPASNRQLSSWKEIANYLGVSVRTAQVWERDRGLPVRRLPGGRLAADPIEVVAWQQRGTVAISPWDRRWFALVTVAAVFAAVGVTYAVVVRRGVPAVWRVDHNTLIVSDRSGRELWSQVFAAPLEPGHYRGNGEEAWIGDLDDGRQSVVFAEYPAGAGVGTVLHCFDEGGRERWRFVPGRTVRTDDGTVFAPPYRFHRFVVGRLGRARHVGIVVTSYQFMSYPNQVALLSGDGRVMREYWHAGHLSQVLLANLDGTTKVYLGGVSNARKQATLVVLDPDHFGGASAEPAGFQLQRLGPGTEDARVFFPATCMTRAVQGYNGVAYLWQQPGQLTVDVHERITLESSGARAAIAYQLSPGLVLHDVGLSDTFVSQHAALYQNHQLDHAFTSAEATALRGITVVRHAHP